MSVDEGVVAGVVIGVCAGALLIAAIIVIVLHVCIYRPRKKRYKKGHVTGNGTAIVYSKPQPREVVSVQDNIFEVPPPKAGSVYSLQNGSLHGGGGGSMILQPAYKAPTTMSYDTTDRVFLTMPTRGPRKKKTKAKRVLSDEMWNSSVKNLFRSRTRSENDGTLRAAGVQYPASVTSRSRAGSEYGSMYGGSQPSLLTIHRAKPVKTKDKKIIYVVDNTTAASRSVVMAPSGRNSPPLSPTRSLSRSYIAAPRQNQSHNTSFDLVDYTNGHLFDSASMARGATSRGYVVHTGSHGRQGGHHVVSASRSPPRSPNRTDETSMKQLQVNTNENVHMVWTEDMRNQLETRDRQRLNSDVSSMASLPRRKHQRAPGEHLYKYDPGSHKLTQL